MSLHSYSQTALDLDGVDDFVQTSFPSMSAAAPRTIEAWIKTTANANPSNGGIQQIITDWGTFVTGGGFAFNVLCNNAIRMGVNIYALHLQAGFYRSDLNLIMD